MRAKDIMETRRAEDAAGRALTLVGEADWLYALRDLAATRLKDDRTAGQALALLVRPGEMEGFAAAYALASMEAVRPPLFTLSRSFHEGIFAGLAQVSAGWTDRDERDRAWRCAVREATTWLGVDRETAGRGFSMLRAAHTPADSPFLDMDAPPDVVSARREGRLSVSPLGVVRRSPRGDVVGYSPVGRVVALEPAQPRPSPADSPFTLPPSAPRS